MIGEASCFRTEIPEGGNGILLYRVRSLRTGLPAAFACQRMDEEGSGAF